MRTLSVRVLGAFDVETAELSTLGSRKARLLLRLLAIARGRVVPTSDLVEALWGTAPPASPADQVAVLVSRLRRVLGPDRIEHRDRGYRLRHDWLDADELAAVVDEVERRRQAGTPAGAAAAARLALALVRGDVPVYDDDPAWVLDESAGLQRLVQRARRLATVSLLEAGSWREASDLAEADLHRNPLDEEAVRLFMQANAFGGRPAMALAAYADLRTRLVDELGTDPAPDSQQLHAAILRGEITEPSDATELQPHLVGREVQLAHLDRVVDRAAAQQVQLAAVLGEPGMGKTTVLRALAARRAQAGNLVLTGSCGQLDHSIPLDALFVALSSHLRQLDHATAAQVLGPEAALLSPLLGLDPQIEDRYAPLLVEGAIGPALLFAALSSVLQRIAADATVVLTIDDAHQAGPVLAQWLTHVQRQPLRLAVVVACRTGEGDPLPARDVVELGPLDRAAATELVGAARVDELYRRSLGHPLFLSELASSSEEEVPSSLVAAITQRCDQLGAASGLLRAAALIGPPIDLDLLSEVLHVPAVQVLDGIELATARGLLVEEAGSFAFRHELVRSAIAQEASAGRAALLHREAARVLAARSDTDPIRVAEHARRGGDDELAARSLHAAALRAAERFDHATAEELLDQSLELRADTGVRLARARVRTLRGHYESALADVLAEGEPDAAALEVGAWASYFARDFDQAVRFAHDGQLAAEQPELRARCLIVGGRTHHARGDLRSAQRLLTDAADLASGSDRVAASAWLGVLRSHESRFDEALDLLRTATLVDVGAEQTSAALHALLFTGYAHAMRGRPARALAEFERYTSEVDRRHVPRFAGRGVNFGGWVIRNVGDPGQAVDAHVAALELAESEGTREVRVAALEDLAEDRLVAGDLDAAAGRLEAAEKSLHGDLVFGWRLAMKLQSLRARLALKHGDAEDALRVASGLEKQATAAGVPRYASLAAVLVHRARGALGEPVDLDALDRDLKLTNQTAAIEGWWWTGETGADLHVPALVERAESLVAGLAREAGPYGDALRAHADRRLAEWRLSAR